MPFIPHPFHRTYSKDHHYCKKISIYELNTSFARTVQIFRFVDPTIFRIILTHKSKLYEKKLAQVRVRSSDALECSNGPNGENNEFPLTHTLVHLCILVAPKIHRLALHFLRTMHKLLEEKNKVRLVCYFLD